MQQPLIARVTNGRLVLDEPTDLPEGEEVELVRADANAIDDDLSDDERRQLVLAKLRSRRPQVERSSDQSGR